MNAKNVKPHTSVDESLEAFRPFPAYRDNKLVHRNGWLQFFKELIHNKH